MKPEEFWDEDHMLKDLLFDTNNSIAKIADELGVTQWYVQKRIKQLGLEWVKRKNRKLSRGCGALLEIMQQLLPGEEIITEHPLGERLRLDIYCDSYKLGAEYHGRQHFFYSDLFYADETAFKDAQKRDERKITLCQEQGIALVVFRFTDELTHEAVFDRMVDALQTTKKQVEEKKPTLVGNHFYEQAKARQREYRKQKYREYKKWRDSK